MRGGAPAGREVGDAGALQDRTEDGRAGARLDPQGLREGAAGPDDLVVEERGVQALEADLGCLFEDAQVRRAPGERRTRAEVAGALPGTDSGALGRPL